MFCVKCGYELPDHVLFCSKCGVPLNVKFDAPIFEYEDVCISRPSYSFLITLLDVSNYKFVAHGYNSAYLHVDMDIPIDSLDNLLSVLKECSDWEENYYDDSATDGISWTLKVNTPKLKMNSGGYNKFPTNYDSIKSKIFWELRKIQLKYSKEPVDCFNQIILCERGHGDYSVGGGLKWTR